MTTRAKSSPPPYRDLPILDIGSYLGGDPEALERLALQLRSACSEIGFLFLRNHGIDQAIIQAAFDATKELHALPDREKLAIKIDNNQRGYIPPKATLVRHSEYNKNTKFDANETFVVATEFDEAKLGVDSGKRFYGRNQWPKNHPEVKTGLTDYMSAVTKLGKKILPIYARALDLEADFFTPYFNNNYTYARFAHYPPVPDLGDNEFGLGPHADTGFMTMLPPANVEGLEILGSDDNWFRAPQLDDCLLVNIGMYLSRWTNDFFRATPHRVMPPEGDHRYSIPCFVNTGFEMRAECLPTCTGPDNPPRYPPQTYWEFFEWYMTNSYPHYEEFHEQAS